MNKEEKKTRKSEGNFYPVNLLENRRIDDVTINDILPFYYHIKQTDSMLQLCCRRSDSNRPQMMSTCANDGEKESAPINSFQCKCILV